MNFGLSQEQYDFILKHVLRPLTARGAKLYCYGSRARGDNSPFSDLDLMVHAESDLSEDVSRMDEFLQNSNFPYQVDLVEWSQFSESYKPGYLKDRIEVFD